MQSKMTQQQLIAYLESVVEPGTKIKATVPFSLLHVYIDHLPVSVYKDIVQHAMFIYADFIETDLAAGIVYGVSLTAEFPLPFEEHFVK